MPTLSPEVRQQRVQKAIVRVAARWLDPQHGPRQSAVGATLEAPNRFTEEAVAFAVNQQMHLLKARALMRWLQGRHASQPCRVGVLNAGNLPMVGLQDWLAVVLAGHAYVGSLSSKSPALLRAFVGEVQEEEALVESTFTDAEALFSRVEALIATGRDETMDWVRDQCAVAGLPQERCLLRGHRYAVAVLDGREEAEEAECLAEDALLHEGMGCRNVALIWAPEGLPPDAYLDAFARFRAVFPAHPERPGALTLQKAFLEAVGQSHAYDDGLTFLVSKGPPEVQRPGHVRWVTYQELPEVEAWLAQHVEDLQLVVHREGLRLPVPVGVASAALGQAQRPPLDWCPDGRDTLSFLLAL